MKPPKPNPEGVPPELDAAVDAVFAHGKRHKRRDLEDVATPAIVIRKRKKSSPKENPKETS